MAETKVAKGRREEYTDATRQALLSAGLAAFAQDGFQAANMEAISRAARVTRGAFYHHFADKRALFDAVVVSLQAEVAAKIEAKAKAERVVWERLEVGIEAYLDACLDPAFARIVVQEAPVVLGAKRYDEIEETSTRALLIATLKALKQRGELAIDDVVLLGRMLDAMVCEMAIMLPDASEPKVLRSRGRKIIRSLLESLRR